MVRLRTLTATTVLTMALAGCGHAAAPAATPTPRFVMPATSGPASAAPAAGASSGAPAGAAPSPTPSGSGKPGSKAPAGASPPGGARSGPFTYVFPVAAGNVDFHPTHGKYPATDLFADCGEPVVAVIDGEVLEVSRTDRYVKGRPDGPLNGGLSVSLLGDDGVRYYGSHLRSVQSGIDAGVRVRAGQRLGALGRTGNANGVCHLHFGISPPCARTGDWKVRRGVVWPAPYLTSWRRGGAKSPVATVAAWQRANKCKA